MKKLFFGRATRSRFWLTHILIYVVTRVLLPEVTPPEFIESNLTLVWIIIIGIYLLAAVFSVNVSWRRMHDLGNPGGYSFIPFYGPILCAFYKGQKIDNQYGVSPYKKD